VIASYAFLIGGRAYSYTHSGGYFGPSLIRGAWMVADPAGIRPHDPMLSTVSLHDDHYLIRHSAEARANDPMNFATLLKLALRQRAGEFNPTAATLTVIDIRGATDWWARHTRTADHVAVDAPR
jgi:hypothetical protein